MTKNCLHCGKPIQSRRSTKKYCSDTCKQLAFYKRSALTLNDSERQITHEPPMTEESLNDTLLSHQKDSDERLNVNRPAQPLNDKQAFTVNNSFMVKEDEPPFDWVHSKLVDAIADRLDTNCETLFMFQHHGEHWGVYILPTVKWISLRLRCLIENLLRLSNFPEVSYDTILTIKEAFTAMINSHNFKMLTANYPFTTLIKDLHEKLTLIVKEHNHYESIRFRLTVSRKVELIATRFMLADFVPHAKFSELNFHE